MKNKNKGRHKKYRREFTPEAAAKVEQFTRQLAAANTLMQSPLLQMIMDKAAAGIKDPKTKEILSTHTGKQFIVMGLLNMLGNVSVEIVDDPGE